MVFTRLGFYVLPRLISCNFIKLDTGSFTVVYLTHTIMSIALLAGAVQVAWYVSSEGDGRGESMTSTP